MWAVYRNNDDFEKDKPVILRKNRLAKAHERFSIIDSHPPIPKVPILKKKDYPKYNHHNNHNHNLKKTLL